MMTPLLLTIALGGQPGTIQPERHLCIDATGNRWRQPVHIDALEHALVTGGWATPDAGDSVEKPDGSTVSWRIPGEGDGDRGPRGGYVYYTFNSDESYPALLDARGHSLCYVNGNPRGGDVYNRGTLRLPFMVKEGRNELLFRTGRGPVNPVVRAASVVAEEEMSNPGNHVAFIGGQDQTLPDLVAGEPVDVMAAVLVYNVSPDPLESPVLEASVQGHTTLTRLATLQPMSFLKVPFRIHTNTTASSQDIEVKLLLRHGETILDTEMIKLIVKDASDLHQRTFQSDIDGSVQYYAVRPATHTDESLPGIALSLHGASVEARRQASCYQSREWVHVVAPTNRRPFGFDWEHWGRLDAMEALEDASARYPNDPAKRWLTGHSMGGHGTWQLGATLPDQWAAIAPSAGWISFWTYGGPDRYRRDGGIEEILHRAANPSDTLLLKDNLERLGIYVLHGDADDNVPVDQARQMRRVLGEFHPDWSYYERPGAGHWWGNQCMDWPPLFDFLKERERPSTVDHVRFTTVDPRASAECNWVRVEAQEISLEPSHADLRVDRGEGVISGTTENISRLSIDPSSLDESIATIHLEIDSSNIDMPRVDVGQRLHLAKTADGWQPTPPPPPSLKGPHRAGPFRDAFDNDVLLVYGTRGTPAESERLAARARLDAERWWYRGNGYMPFIPDTAFDPLAEPDRNIVLYGNADTNAHWGALLATSPITVRRGGVDIGTQAVDGDDLAAVFIQPRPGSDIASVGVVASSGAVGHRLTEQMPFFFAGVGWPDWMVLDPSTLHVGPQGIVATGFFAEDWTLDPSQTAFGERIAVPSR